jgi:hypothetical protein
MCRKRSEKGMKAEAGRSGTYHQAFAEWKEIGTPHTFMTFSHSSTNLLESEKSGIRRYGR